MRAAQTVVAAAVAAVSPVAITTAAVAQAAKAQAAVCLAALAGDIEEDQLEPSERNVYDELAELGQLWLEGHGVFVRPFLQALHHSPWWWGIFYANERNDLPFGCWCFVGSPSQFLFWSNDTTPLDLSQPRMASCIQYLKLECCPV